jgi:multiple sugar transport system permease protein
MTAVLSTKSEPQPRGFHLTLAQREALTAYVILIPAFIYFAIFFFYPIGVELWASLRDGQPLIGPSSYVGLDNYQRALHDNRTINSIEVTFKFTIGTTLFTAGLGLALAVMLNQPLRGRILFRSVIFFPYLISTVIVALIWRNILDPYLGVLNSTLYKFGLPEQFWLTEVDKALPTIIGLTVWQNMGYAMILFLAGLQNIPMEYYEAAKIDGANGCRQFRHVTLPLLRPTTLFVVVIGVIGNLQAFIPAYIITRGGPSDATRLFGYHVFNVAFTELNFGYASAQAFLMFLIILVLTITQLGVAGRNVEY